MKNKLKNILNIVLFILFTRFMHEYVTIFDLRYSVVHVNSMRFWQYHEKLDLFMLCFMFLSKPIILYFFAKKYGIINFLDRFNFLISLLFACLLEFFILLQPDHIWYGNEVASKWGCMLMDSILGMGFMHTFFVYKISKFLLKNYTKHFYWLKFLYPKFLEKIPNIQGQLILIFTMSFLFFMLLKYDFHHWQYKVDAVFLYSGVLFLLITVIRTIYNIIKGYKNGKNKSMLWLD